MKYASLRGVFELTKWFILVVFVLFLVHVFLVSIYIVEGPSMNPALKTKDAVVLNKIVYYLANPKRGDIVVVCYPGDPQKTYYVKRIVGLPGEKIEVREGQVYINGQKLIETYVEDQITEPDFSLSVPEGMYFTMGDNRSLSSDSRVWGTVEKRFFLGRVAVTVLPALKVHPQPSY